LNLIRVIPAKGAQLLGRVHFVVDHGGNVGTGRALDLVAAALEAGVPCVQVRSKACSDRLRLEMARSVVRMCHESGATCIVNDRVDIALASKADGAHVGADDLPVAEARRLLGPDVLLGASARTAEDARQAVAAGASYVGVGPCYPTKSKEGLPGPLGPQGLAAIAHGIEAPVLAIGGVTVARVPELLRAGAYGVAVIGAIAAAGDPGLAARQLVSALGAWS
jgi:thiamine-phosphate pyrophosphorylase